MQRTRQGQRRTRAKRKSVYRFTQLIFSDQSRTIAQKELADLSSAQHSQAVQCIEQAVQRGFLPDIYGQSNNTVIILNRMRYASSMLSSNTDIVVNGAQQEAGLVLGYTQNQRKRTFKHIYADMMSGKPLSQQDSVIVQRVCGLRMSNNQIILDMSLTNTAQQDTINEGTNMEMIMTKTVTQASAIHKTTEETPERRQKIKTATRRNNNIPGSQRKKAISSIETAVRAGYLSEANAQIILNELKSASDNFALGTDFIVIGANGQETRQEAREALGYRRNGSLHTFEGIFRDIKRGKALSEQDCEILINF